MSDIDTKWLRAAVVLADELNFCRAAQKLHIGQSTLTKQIIALEHFVRSCAVHPRQPTCFANVSG